MRSILFGIFLLIAPFAFSQSKDELILDGPKDSVLVYAGEGFLSKGNCLLIKFTGDSQEFFNALASFHANDEDQIKRTTEEINIYNVSKPYWVYGTYSVHAKIEQRGTFALSSLQ